MVINGHVTLIVQCNKLTEAISPVSTNPWPAMQYMYFIILAYKVNIDECCELIYWLIVDVIFGWLSVIYQYMEYIGNYNYQFFGIGNYFLPN